MNALVLTYLIGALLSGILYASGVIYHRLFLSPLAKFPGPRLAAATGLYELYFQLIKGGKFTWEIQRLHQRYGPVVRIKPFELHVQDADFYDTLYSGPMRKRDKDPWFVYIGWPGAIFSTQGHALHTERRRVLGQFFSKRAVVELQPVIWEKVRALCGHFSAAAESHSVLELHACFQCLAVDLISQYAFGGQHGFRYLDQPVLTADWKFKANSSFKLINTVRHFPWLYWVAHMVPRLAGMVAPAFAPVYRMEEDQKEVKSKVRAIIAEHNRPDHEKSPAIYPSILDNEDVAPSEKEYRRLADDAIFLTVAGSGAPAQTLAITLFHILNNGDVHQKVTAELFAAFPF
ncbi:hypothetical protein FE257_006995 [Aspergillus nanangensis]|uniref:Cytochrome P450 n=1 Tax=Aspergillus nanangensis TaxID=2582783 RepID=A0AAD4CNA9_ASPNN|nr:hypothetical protein FE257_006995 [Aspergillus nanangensis]